MNSKYISVTIENFQQDTRLCTVSLTNKLSGILLFKIEDNSVIKTIGENLKEMSNYHFENNKIATDNFRFICNTSENVICSTIFAQIQKRNQEIIKEQENCPKFNWNVKVTQTNPIVPPWKNDFKSFKFEKLREFGTQTETSSAVLSNELVVLHNDIVPNVPCNTPITLEDIHNDLNNLESPTSSMEVFHTVDSISLEIPPVEKPVEILVKELVKNPVKHPSSSGNDSDSESDSDSSSDSSETGNYTTLSVNHKPKRRKRSVRTLCVIDSSSSDSEDELVQPTWNECIMEILDECPKTVQKIGDIMSMRFPKRMSGNTPYNSINERCQSLVKDGRAQRTESESNRFKYFV
jgi:hypothetical protein